MRNTKEVFADYGKRFRFARDAKGISPSELESVIKEAIKSEPVSENVINNWVNGYRGIPPVGVLAAIAHALDCSCSYLLGQHDIGSFAIQKDTVDVSMSFIKDIYKDIRDVSIHTEHVAAPNWISNKSKNGISIMDRVLPYLKIAEELGIWIDYLFGLSDIRNEKEYAYYCHGYSDILSGSLLVIRKDGEDDIFGIIMPDGENVVTASGEQISISEFRDMDAKLARDVKI